MNTPETSPPSSSYPPVQENYDKNENGYICPECKRDNFSAPKFVRRHLTVFHNHPPSHKTTKRKKEGSYIRKKYSLAFKHEVANMASQDGANVSHLAKQYNINRDKIYLWRKEFAGNVFQPSPSTPQPSFSPKSKKSTRNIEINFCPCCGLDLLKLGAAMQAASNI